MDPDKHVRSHQITLILLLVTLALQAALLVLITWQLVQ
jgi:hypothetical protein